MAGTILSRAEEAQLNKPSPDAEPNNAQRNDSAELTNAGSPAPEQNHRGFEDVKLSGYSHRIKSAGVNSGTITNKS